MVVGKTPEFYLYGEFLGLTTTDRNYMELELMKTHTATYYGESPL
jgi:hypothetical protein